MVEAYLRWRLDGRGRGRLCLRRRRALRSAFVSRAVWEPKRRSTEKGKERSLNPRASEAHEAALFRRRERRRPGRRGQPAAEAAASAHPFVFPRVVSRKPPMRSVFFLRQRRRGRGEAGGRFRGNTEASPSELLERSCMHGEYRSVLDCNSGLQY